MLAFTANGLHFSGIRSNMAAASGVGSGGPATQKSSHHVPSTAREMDVWNDHLQTRLLNLHHMSDHPLWASDFCIVCLTSGTARYELGSEVVGVPRSADASMGRTGFMPSGVHLGAT